MVRTAKAKDINDFGRKEFIFKEEFPSLRKEFASDPRNLLFSERNGLTLLFNETTIKQHCLDKQRVQEAIESWLNHLQKHEEDTAYGAFFALKKELGLDGSGNKPYANKKGDE